MTKKDDKTMNETTGGSADNATGTAANVDGDVGQAEVQRATDEAERKGYVGTEADPTPNENYTFSGVTSNAPTPETSPDAAKAVGSRRFDAALTGADPARA